MRMIFLLTLVFQMTTVPLSAQTSSSPLKLGAMEVGWGYEGEDIIFTVSSPGKGWVALGTNVKDDIVGASLYMGGVRDETGESYFSERRTVDFGKHEAKVDLGLPERAHDVTSKPEDEGTSLAFRIRAAPVADGEHDLRPGQSIWLILAYSVSDDLGHHSRFRRHVQVVL